MPDGQVYMILFQQVLGLFFSFQNRDRYVSISSSFFSQAFGHGGEIGSGVECWRGYYQSLRATQMGLSLNIGIVVWLTLCVLNTCILIIYLEVIDVLSICALLLKCNNLNIKLSKCFLLDYIGNNVLYLHSWCPL